MTGLALKFENGSARFDFTRVRSGVDHELQTAVVNAITWKESDKVFPTRGTWLQRDAFRGYMVGYNQARHTANFAAVETMDFMKTTRDGLELTDLTMDPVSFENQRLRIDYHGYVGETEHKLSVTI